LASKGHQVDSSKTKEFSGSFFDDESTRLIKKQPAVVQK